MKFFNLFAAASLMLGVAPVHASENRLFARLENATLDCLDYSSKANCGKARGALETYKTASAPLNRSCASQIFQLGLFLPLVAGGPEFNKPMVEHLGLARKYCVTR